MQLSSQKYPNNIRTISGPTNEVRPDDVTLICDTSSAPVVLTLATIPTDYWSTQYKLSILDGNDNAATNSIRINAPAGQTINGLPFFIINTNKGVATISIASNGAYLCSSSLSSGISQAYQTVKKDNVAVTQRSVLNFIGEGVSVADNAGTSQTDITIPGVNTFGMEMEIGTVYQPPFAGTINSLVPLTDKGIIDSQVIKKFTKVYSNNNSVVATPGAGNYVINADLPACSFLTFDNDTGIITFTSAGIYLIEVSCHLKPDNTSSVYWQRTQLAGTFAAGVVKSGRVVCGNYQTFINDTVGGATGVECDISASAILSCLETETMSMKVANFTDRSYDGLAYTNPDYMKFTITKIK